MNKTKNPPVTAGTENSIVIRPMFAEDWARVAEIDLLAFNSFYQKTGREPMTRSRTQANILATLAMHASGCFTASDNRVIGYIFSRSWGNTGWIGTFGIHPDFHGQDVGKKLLTAAVEHLEQSGCTTIGLETMPDSPYNVGFYAHLGFNLTFPTLHLSKPVLPVSSSLSYSLLSELEEQSTFASITALSRAANPKVDYALEAKNAKEFGWGDTLLFGWPQPFGFAIVRTLDTRDGSSQPVCSVVSLVLEPKARDRLGEVLKLLQNFANDKQADQVLLPVNTVDALTLQEALANGFRVARVMIRMIYRGEYARPEGIDLNRWLM